MFARGSIFSRNRQPSTLAAAELDVEAFLQQHIDLVYRVAASYEADPALREDLLQEVVTAIWRSASSFKGDAAFKTFALKVAHNRCLTWVGRQARRPEVFGEDLEGTQCTNPAPDQLLQNEQLLAAVRRLPLGQRQLIGLALEGLSYEEIADVLDISVGNVGVRLNRARTKLKELLHDQR